MRPIAALIGHPAEIDILCGCTRVRTVSPEWLLERLGADATIEDGERRMRCPTCEQRPRLKPVGKWAVTGGRDMRDNPPPVPEWVDMA